MGSTPLSRRRSSTTKSLLVWLGRDPNRRSCLSTSLTVAFWSTAISSLFIKRPTESSG